MIDFIEEMKKVRHYQTYLPFYPERIKGYTDAEIAQIERDCNIHIHGQFRQLLRQMGRCSGGLLWGWDICMYKYTWEYHELKNYQKNKVQDFIDDPSYGYGWKKSNLHPIENKLFLWKTTNENIHYHYLLTTEPDDYLWEQDDYKNDMLITKTDLTILDDLQQQMEYWTNRFSANPNEMSPENYQYRIDNSNELFEYYTIGRLLP